MPSLFCFVKNNGAKEKNSTYIFLHNIKKYMLLIVLLVGPQIVLAVEVCSKVLLVQTTTPAPR